MKVTTMNGLNSMSTEIFMLISKFHSNDDDYLGRCQNWVLKFTICFFFSLSLASVVVAESNPSKPSTFEWTKVRGIAQDISVGADGETFVVGTDGVVWRWRREGSGWSRRSGIIQRIAVDPKGSHWGINEDGQTYRMSGLWWRQLDDLAQDLAIGSDGTVIKSNQDDTLARWDKFSGRWRPITGTGKRIAVGPKGNPWVVKADGTLAHYDGREWQTLPGQANDIAVGPDGSAYIIDASGISRWDDKNNLWQVIPDTEGGIAISVGMGNHPWYVTSAGAIYASSLFSIEDKEIEESSSDTFTEAVTEDGKSEENLALRRSASAVADPAAITSDEPIVFKKVKGTAIDLAIGAEGSVFALQSDSVLSRWSNERSRFQNFPGTLIRIVVGPDGNPLGINTDRDIFRHDGKDWKSLKQKAEDIAVGADGTVIISDEQERLFRMNNSGTRFERISGKGDKLAVAPDGAPWVIRKDDSIFRCNTDPCTRLRRKGRDIAIGPDGSIFMVSTENKLFIFDRDEDKWQRILVSQSPIAVAVGPQGRPWFTDTKNNVYASTFFERDESNDQAVARLTKKPTVVSTSLLPTTKSSAFTFTKRINFQEITIGAAATDNIGIGIDGSVLIVADSGTKILRYNEKSKVMEDILTTTDVLSITSDIEGRVWMITFNEVLFQKKKDGSSFTSYSLPPTLLFQPPRIAIGGDGSVFAVWLTGELFKFNPSKKKFEKFISGTYRDVAVTVDGRPWVIDESTLLVKEFDGTKFVKPGGITKIARAISIGAGGTVYIIDGTAPPFKLNKWNATNKSFDKVDETASHVAVEPDGRPWFLNIGATGNAFRAK
jgi:streptogramin lyase